MNTKNFVSTLALTLGLAACSAAGIEEMSDTAVAEDELFPATGTLWLPNKIDGWTTINVCWETAGFASAKEKVRIAVREQWEYAAKVKFTGWGTCAAGVNGLRIKISDEGPHVKALGRSLYNMGAGMVLNFTFGVWTGKKDANGNSVPWCGLAANFDNCVKGIAVHEFGHALGIAHEHNRLDSPISCTADPQGTNGDLELGNFDWDSTMNYCNSKWNNGGVLSSTDKTRIADIYGGVRVQTFDCFFPPCVFEVADVDGGNGLLRYGDLVALGGRGGKYLRMDAGSDVKSDQSHIRSHEKWTVVDPFNGFVGGGLVIGSSVALRSHNGRFLSARNDDAIGWASTIGPREIWRIVRPPNTLGGTWVDVADPIAFWNENQQGYLYDGQGNPAQRPAIGAGEVWYFRGPVSR